MKKHIFCVVGLAAIAAIIGVGCNDGGIESDGGDAVAYLELLHGQAVYGDYGMFTDKRDGTTYKWVTIGNQTWMAENLNYVIGNSRCYNDDTSYCDKYGRLYDYEAARNACPDGWRLPEYFDVIYWGNPETMGRKLKAKSGWEREESGKDGNGTDEFGFNALPGGHSEGAPTEDYDGIYAYFEGVKYSGYWWILFLDDGSDYPYPVLHLTGESQIMGLIHYDWVDQEIMNSVRCLRAPD